MEKEVKMKNKYIERSKDTSWQKVPKKERQKKEQKSESKKSSKKPNQAGPLQVLENTNKIITTCEGQNNHNKIKVFKGNTPY